MGDAEKGPGYVLGGIVLFVLVCIASLWAKAAIMGDLDTGTARPAPSVAQPPARWTLAREPTDEEARGLALADARWFADPHAELHGTTLLVHMPGCNDFGFDHLVRNLRGLNSLDMIECRSPGHDRNLDLQHARETPPPPPKPPGRSSGGPHCVRGCPCGASCIPCSHRCRH